MENLENLDERDVVNKKIADALANTSLIKIMQDYSGKDTGICVDMIKASVNHNANYLDNALKNFIAKVIAE